MNVKELELQANQIRQDILEIAYRAEGPSHPGPALSCADIVTALYFRIMHIDADNPNWSERDRFVLSKGHACPVLYSALARKGYFPVEELLTVRHLDSHLQGHPDMRKTPGVDMTSGSLGNGLSLGEGMALYARHNKKKFRTYVLLGDGELNEGVVWEAVMSAGAWHLDNLTVIVDYNHLQSCGAMEDILSLAPMDEKWKAFGWNILNVNGHEMREVVSALDVASRFYGQPTVIIANTVKGKGISYMEHNNAWHQKRPTETEYELGMKELKEARLCLL